MSDRDYKKLFLEACELLRENQWHPEEGPGGRWESYCLHCKAERRPDPAHPAYPELVHAPDCPLGKLLGLADGAE